MCDFSTILGYVLAGEVAMLAAFISCGIAIGLNVSFFGAPGSPIPFGMQSSLQGWLRQRFLRQQHYLDRRNVVARHVQRMPLPQQLHWWSLPQRWQRHLLRAS